MAKSKNQDPTAVISGRYRLLHPIGHGGMSTVFLAEDLKLPGKLWAVKRFNQSEAFLADPHHEAALLLQLSHPYLPHVVDFIPAERGRPSSSSHEEQRSEYDYLVMEYIEGDTLQIWLDRHIPSPPAAPILEIGLQVCELLQYLHSREPSPIVYRDLKPANLMLDKQGRIRLIDFGIARSYKPGQPSDTVPLGTTAFAAPEQFHRSQTDPRADLYSLGALLYYLLSGGQFYAGKMLPLRQLKPDLQEETAEVVHRLLEHDPGDRYMTAAEAKNALYHASLQMEIAALALPELTSGQAKPSYRPPTALLREQSGTIEPISLTSFAKLIHERRNVVVVGALYPGAGATFIASALARCCARMGVSSIVAEAAAREPELASLLHFPDRLNRDWRLNGTRWITLPKPDPDCLGMSYLDEASREMILQESKDTPLFLDISHVWLEEQVQELCLAAEARIVVLDAFPGRWGSIAANRNLQALKQLEEQNRPIHWIMNKDAMHKRRSERLTSAPGKLSAIVPDISTELKLQALDKGMLIQDKPGVGAKLDAALRPILQALPCMRAAPKGASHKAFSFLRFF